jgi:hypothetical protein
MTSHAAPSGYLAREVIEPVRKTNMNPLFFIVPGSSGYGSRIFIQQPSEQTEKLHELAKMLSYWGGADKTVTISSQIISGTSIKIETAIQLKGYEMAEEELVVMKKRCLDRRLIDLTSIISQLEQTW